MKGWDARLRQDDEHVDDARQGESLLAKHVKLPPSRVQGPGDDIDPGGPAQEGMVTAFFPGGAYVRLGGRELLCSIAKTFRGFEGATALAVGDDVTVALAPPHGDTRIDKQRADGVILSRRTRRTALARPQPTSDKRRDAHEEGFEKVIVANMDALAIIAAIRRPALRTGLIDRFLIMAERGRLRPMIVVNKIDLERPAPHLLSELSGGGDADVLAVSAQTGEGLDILRAALAGRRTVMAGASGVGKSSLINAIVPGADLPSQAVRAKDQRGRHTTAAATVHELPGGGMVVDTPGIRELAVEMGASELPWYFPDIAALAPRCKFNDCSHTHEPQCAVIAAVEAGRLDPRRYESYLRILDTLER